MRPSEHTLNTLQINIEELIRWLNETNSETLDLSRQHETGRFSIKNYMENLILGLQQSKHTTTLKLNNNNLSGKCIGKIAQLIAQNSNLKHLDLSGNPISGESAVRIAKHITKSPHILTVKLNINENDKEKTQTQIKSITDATNSYREKHTNNKTFRSLTKLPADIQTLIWSMLISQEKIEIDLNFKNSEPRLDNYDLGNQVEFAMLMMIISPVLETYKKAVWRTPLQRNSITTNKQNKTKPNETTANNNAAKNLKQTSNLMAKL